MTSKQDTTPTKMMEVWYSLNGKVDFVEIASDANVAKLRKAIKAENPSLRDVDPRMIDIYDSGTTSSGDPGDNVALRLGKKLKDVRETTDEDPLVVVAPDPLIVAGKRPAEAPPGGGQRKFKKLRDLAGYKLTSGTVTEFSIDSMELLNPSATKTVRYFSRDGVPDLFNEIMHDQKGERYYNIALIGNPGSGKSNLVYAAAECLAFYRSTPVVWVGRRYREEPWNVRFFLPSQGETKACVEILEDGFKDLEDILRLEKAQEAEVLVLDAYTRSDDDSARDGAAAIQWAGGTKRKNNKRVIHVSSLGAFAHKQTVRDQCNLREVQMRIWTRNDFVRSLDDAHLKQQLCNTLAGQPVNEMTNEELVDMKFFFSGINARWFFNTTIDQITSECTEIIERLYPGSANEGMKTKQAINSFQATIITGEQSIKVFTSPLGATRRRQY